MSPKLAAILMRHLGRLRANRSIVVGGVFAVLVLLLTALSTSIVARAQGIAGAELLFAFQQRLWTMTGSLFTTIVFVLSIVLGTSLVNDDLKAGTIFPILARPVSRAGYFLGSWFGAAAVVLAIEGLRCVVSTTAGLIMAGKLSAAFAVAVVAMLAGVVLHLALFAAFGAFLSTGAAVLTGLVLVVIESLGFAPSLPDWVTYPARAIAVFLPLAEWQESTIASGLKGATHDVGPLLEIVAYRLAWTVALLAVGVLAFQRRELSARG